MENNMNLAAITLERFCKEIKENMENDKFKPFLGIGKPGLETIEGIEQIAVELGIKTKIIKLTDNIVSSLKGIPLVVDITTNKPITKDTSCENMVTTCAPSELLPTEDRDGKRGILILDGITSVSAESRMMLCSLLDSSRSFGHYNLPDDWLVVCLGCDKDDDKFQGIEFKVFSFCESFNIDV